jgi:hypothetical protein
VQAVDEGLMHRHIVSCMEMSSNHIEELISLRGDEHNASPSPVGSEGADEVHALVLPGNRCR